MLQIQEKNAVVMAKGTTDASRGNMDIYVFIVDGMLVDTGPKVLLKEFIPFFESSDYEQVVITHHHEDHTGGARWIEEKYPNAVIKDYKHRGRVNGINTTMEKFKLWLQEGEREFGVLVNIEFDKETERVIDITFREVQK